MATPIYPNGVILDRMVQLLANTPTSPKPNGLFIDFMDLIRSGEPAGTPITKAYIKDLVDRATILIHLGDPTWEIDSNDKLKDLFDLADI